MPDIFLLDPTEIYQSDFGSDEEQSVKLLNIITYTEPLFHDGSWIDVFACAEIEIEINGQRHVLHCRPYQMPVCCNGLWIQADMLHAVSLGAAIKTDATKAVRFCASRKQWWQRRSAVFPVKDYRWRTCVFRTHTWNGFVQVQGDGSVYYHAGEDLALQKDKHALVSPVDGVITKAPGPDGDGQSNPIVVADEHYIYRFAHCNAERIRSDLEPDLAVKRGEFLARTGNTWNGKAVPDDHLHWGMALKDGTVVNTYPFMVASYQAAWRDEILPVAGGFRFCRVGDTLCLDASRSIVPVDSTASYRWLLHDDQWIDGSSSTLRYERPGSYCEVLEVTDQHGQQFHDVVWVRVSDEDSAQNLPRAFINYHPMRCVKVGTDIDFYIRHWQMSRPMIDFGDGTAPRLFERYQQHAYTAPGHYIVTVTDTTNSAVSAHFRCVVHVDPA